jgi:hypothetical protein
MDKLKKSLSFSETLSKFYSFHLKSLSPKNIE